jgi:hypothetical protein
MCSEKPRGWTVRGLNFGRGRKVFTETPGSAMGPTHLRLIARLRRSGAIPLFSLCSPSVLPVSLHSLGSYNFAVFLLFYIVSIYCSGRYLLECVCICWSVCVFAGVCVYLLECVCICWSVCVFA